MGTDGQILGGGIGWSGSGVGRPAWKGGISLYSGNCRPGLRALLKQIHPVDRSLLVFMVVLLLQSAYSIVCPGAPGTDTGDIDVIVRTASAAIFGYFLSANFIRRGTGSGQVPAPPAARTLKTGTGIPAAPTAVRARIGFASGGDAPEADGGGTEQAPGMAPDPCGLQVGVATAIGLFCLAVLLTLRNLAQMGIVPPESENVSATVIQFRDFVSGCIGFLIGCPTYEGDSVP